MYAMSLETAETDAPIDVAALTTLLDGRYKAVRDLARENLALRPEVLEKAETLSTEDYRELVKDVVVELASTGQTGWGFPKEYGGGGDIGASVAAFETSSFGDLSVVVTSAPRSPPSRPSPSVTCPCW